MCLVVLPMAKRRRNKGAFGHNYLVLVIALVIFQNYLKSKFRGERVYEYALSSRLKRVWDNK